MMDWVAGKEEKNKELREFTGVSKITNFVKP